MSVDPANVVASDAEAAAITKVKAAYDAALVRMAADHEIATQASRASFVADQTYANESFAASHAPKVFEPPTSVAHQYVRRFEHAVDRAEARDDDASSLLQSSYRMAEAVHTTFLTCANKPAVADFAVTLLEAL